YHLFVFMDPVIYIIIDQDKNRNVVRMGLEDNLICTASVENHAGLLMHAEYTKISVELKGKTHLFYAMYQTQVLFFMIWIEKLAVAFALMNSR
ncbi:hypothetical protein ACJX0J_013220, partial [Zea mays]